MHKESCVTCAQAEGEKNGTDSWRRLGRTRGASGKPQHPGFSANVSPLGVPDGVREAICRAAGKIDRYPDPLCRKLIQKLSEELSCPEEWIVCGNGAADLIYRLFQAENRKSAADSSGICGV